MSVEKKQLLVENLAEIARHWICPSDAGNAELEEDARAFGASEEAVRAARERMAEADVCMVFPENWDAYQLWRRIGHLWRYGSFGGLISLEWASVMAKLALIERVTEKPIDAEQVEQLELIEAMVIREQRNESGRRRTLDS